MPSIEITSVGKRRSFLGVDFRMHKKHTFRIEEPISVVLGNSKTGKSVELDISETRKEDIPPDLQNLQGSLIESFAVSMTPEEVAALESGEGKILIHSGETYAPMAGIGQKVSPDETGMRLQIYHTLD